MAYRTENWGSHPVYVDPQNHFNKMQDFYGFRSQQSQQQTGHSSSSSLPLPPRVHVHKPDVRYSHGYNGAPPKRPNPNAKMNATLSIVSLTIVLYFVLKHMKWIDH